MAAGIRAMFGTDTKTLHVGRGAQNGILAGILAQAGFSSCAAAIEAWACLVSSTVDAYAISAISKSGPWQILENSFKPYPCGIVIHPLIDGSLELFASFRKEGEPGNDTHRSTADSREPLSSLEDIAKIEVVVNPQCVRLCNVRHPRTGLETIFSLYHGCAVALVHGRAGPAEFSDAVASEDSVVAGVRDRIMVRTDPDIRDDEAWLHFWSRMSGEGDRESISRDEPPTTSIHVEHATGSVARPMTGEQLERKFQDQAERVLGVKGVRKVMDVCWSLEEIADVRGFVGMLARQVE